LVDLARDLLALDRQREIRERRRELAREAAEASAPADGEKRTVIIEVPEELE